MIKLVGWNVGRLTGFQVSALNTSAPKPEGGRRLQALFDEGKVAEVEGVVVVGRGQWYEPTVVGGIGVGSKALLQQPLMRGLRVWWPKGLLCGFYNHGLEAGR